MMARPCRFAFGMTGQGKCAISYLEGDRLLYPVGIHLATYSGVAEEVRAGAE
jgi:hypothetical protein